MKWLLFMYVYIRVFFMFSSMQVHLFAHIIIIMHGVSI